MVLPLEDLIQSKAPLALAVERSQYSSLTPLIRFGAAVASLSVLLSLLAGISRTVFAMASNKDLPSFLDAVHPKHKVPHKAEILVGIVVAFIVGYADLRTTIGFSSFAILIYYAIANFSALKLSRDRRFFPKLFAIGGFTICILLAVNLPRHSVVGGLILFCIGSAVYALGRIKK